jgi:4-amino-4-deoxy-L-arabinose transferase-like glycosyltransferase
MTPRHGGDAPGRDWALVGGAWLALVLVLSVWLAMDRRPPEWDYANHLERAVRCAQDLGTGDWRAIVERSSFYPPIVPCAAGLLYRLAPSDLAAAQAVILLFLGLGMVGTYLLGRELGGSTTGVAAAWIFGSAPFVLYTALRFQLDLPLAAMVALGLAALARTDGFTRLPASLLAGVAFAAGMLVKPPFAAYVVGPVLWLLARERSWAALRNFVLTVVVAAAVSLPWYGPRLFGLPMQLANRSIKNAALEGKPETFTAASLAFYPTWIVPQLGVLAVVLLLAGLAVAAARRRGFALVAFLAPLVLFILVRNKDLRYTLPLLPMAAVLAGMAVGEAAALSARVRVPALAVLAVVGAAQLGATAWGMPPIVPLPLLNVPSVLGTAVIREDWRQRDVLRAIAADSGGRPATVSVVPNHHFFSVSNIRYYALRDGLPLRFTRAWDGEPIGIDYVVLKSGGIGPTWTAERIERATAQFAREPALARVYPVVGEFALPDGSTATLRARRIVDGVATSPERLAGMLEAAIRKQLGSVARDVDNLAVRIEHDGDIVRGRVKRIELSADSARIAEYRRPDAAVLRVRALRLVADDVLVNPFSLDGDGRAVLLDAGRLRLAHADVGGDDLQAFLGGLRAFRRARVRLTAGGVYFTARQPLADVSALVRVRPATDRPFALEVERASLGWIPLPSLLVNWVVRHYDPTPQLKSRLPFPVEIGPVTVNEQALRIGE